MLCGPAGTLARVKAPSISAADQRFFGFTVFDDAADSPGLRQNGKGNKIK